MQTFLTAAVLLLSQVDHSPFAIEVLDDQTGRGVPLVELTTTSGVTYVTDSAGLVAFDDPTLMNQRVYFTVSSHGYEFRQDGFGFRGMALDVRPGGTAQLKIKRMNIAERLYRITGEGIYRDSVLLGRQPPIQQPLLNAKVTGSDSVMTAAYRGRLYWFWGDTNWPAYPLGLFHTPGATSSLPRASGESAAQSPPAALDPDRGIDLQYFTGENGFARATAKMPGDGPTWISGLAVLPDAGGQERMLCGYVKVKQPMKIYRRGLARWNDATEAFERLSDFAPDVPLFPDGHPFIHGTGDSARLYCASPYPLVRTRPTAESYQDLASYEAFTCLLPGSTADDPQIDRDQAGRARYAWRTGAPPVDAQRQAQLVRQRRLRADEGLLQLRDVDTGKPVLAHAGSVAWNAWRQRFVMLAVQSFGSSFLGEVWLAEADAPVGPWVYARKVVTHGKYSFYNPKHHVLFDQDGGRRIYFEGTYTHTFSGNEQRTPRYDYNQIMYRLDLADERLALPVAVYKQGDGLAMRDAALAARAAFEQIAFFALDRPVAGAVAVSRPTVPGPKQDRRAAEPLLWMLPPDWADASSTVPLYEYRSEQGPPRYDVRADLNLPSYQRGNQPVGRVWPSPWRSP